LITNPQQEGKGERLFKKGEKPVAYFREIMDLDYNRDFTTRIRIRRKNRWIQSGTLTSKIGISIVTIVVLD
jgi:hypothetical protein